MAILRITEDLVFQGLFAAATLGILLLSILLERRKPSGNSAAALRLGERQMDLALAGSNDGLWHWNLLTDATHFSLRVHELLDYRPPAHIDAFLELVHPDDREATRQSLIAPTHDRREAEFRLRLQSQEYRWFRARGTVERDADDRPIQMAGSISDITDRKLAEAAIQRHAMQQGLIAEFGQMALANPPIGELISQAITALTHGLSAQYCRLLAVDGDDEALVLAGAAGWDPQWLADRRYDAVEETEDRFIIGVREAIVIEDFDSETRFRPSAMLRAHRIRSGAETLICGTQGAYGVLGVYSRETKHWTWENVNFLRSITNILAASMDRKIADERLTYMARFDPLTGLPNRTMFLDRLWAMLAEADHGTGKVGVIFIDLDRFKLVNDTLGHFCGDDLLLQAAQRLSTCARPTGVIGRLGGDEFAVALANLNLDMDAGLIAQEILGALVAPFHLAGQTIYISASLGISIYPGNGREPDTLLKNADTAMYRAKKSGGNTIEFYVPQMNQRGVERLKMETELRGALERGEFVLHYQPKADIGSGDISGFEALLRWQHPERGLIPPADFISILEDTGLIIPVGAWVVSTVCRQLRQWQIAGVTLHPVAVNLSPRQFAQADLDAVVGNILHTTGVDPGLLEFELTESILMTDSEAAVKVLNNLRAFGIRLSVDDFGTGYSSLAYLKRFPLDALKIDRMFIRDVTTDADGATIVLAIINLAHSLKLHVVAEGVETYAQLQFLQEHGCDEVQGYYFSHPQPAEDCTRALLEGWRLPHPNSVRRLARLA